MWIQNNSNQTAEGFFYGNFQNSDGNEGAEYTEQFAKEQDCRNDPAFFHKASTHLCVCLSVHMHASYVTGARSYRGQRLISVVRVSPPWDLKRDSGEPSYWLEIFC